MLPKVYLKLKNLVKQEGRILLIVLALKKKKILNIYEAIYIYNIPYTTLQHHLIGHTFQAKLYINSYKITQNKEELLIR
jgi:hypothetical protein